MEQIQSVKNELQKYANPMKAKFLPKFFKTCPGGYAEGDQFIGVMVPEQRKVAKKYYKGIALEDIAELLKESVHEYRFTALLILILKYEQASSEAAKQAIVDLYLSNTARINNWDLVDVSAHKILGPYFIDKEKDLLYALANSNDLWQQRIAIITTFYFIRNQQFEDTLKMAELLLNHKHDLIHKAVGWMLREIGKRDFAVEFNFLKEHYHQMPRTMLRYAIEKFDEDLRQRFLKGVI